MLVNLIQCNMRASNCRIKEIIKLKLINWNIVFPFFLPNFWLRCSRLWVWVKLDFWCLKYLLSFELVNLLLQFINSIPVGSELVQDIHEFLIGSLISGKIFISEHVFASLPFLNINYCPYHISKMLIK